MIHLNVKLKVKYTGLSSSLEQESAKNMNSEETTKIFSRGICTVLKEVSIFLNRTFGSRHSFLSKYGIKERGIR